ncbi:putative plasma membrane ferric-chelate reductase, partial [Aureobasidium melanogenum]|uniref:Putative plasma membrane ferric-chelate reductase n=1 Tax=Aureobasidium melanogenum (strain CBS 110374) TaxID=1043003 RepID=A0A074W023_AURM1
MPSNEYCLHAVSVSYNYLTFSGEGHGTYYGPKCINPLWTISTYASGKTFCTDDEIAIGFEKIRKECESDGLAFLDWQQVVANITHDDIAQMRVVEFEEVPAGTNITNPVRLSKSFFGRVGNTLMTWEYEMNWHHQSSVALYGFWGIALGVSTIVRFLKSTNISFHAPYVQSSTATQILQSAWMWVRVNLIIPPAFGSHHQRLLYWCTIPTRMESAVVLAFYLLTTYLSVSHYRLISNNIYWNDKSQQLWRYVADRTGIMAYATLPLIWIFAGRNNVFMWATGLSYRTFNIYHRHIARAGTILAIVHSAVYTWLFVEFEGWSMFKREFTQLWLLLGVVATLTMCFLLLFSASWLRVKFYEIFLVLHIVLSVITLAGCFLHTSIFDNKYDTYLWPIVIVWFLDRVLRLLRLIACNIHVHLSKQVMHRTRSVASYSKESEVIRLDIRTSSILAQPAAGQCYYLYQPSTWQGYENHPFTLGAWYSQSSASEDTDTYLLQHDDLPNEFDQSDFSSKYQATVRSLTFWVRPYDGWTRRLRDECLLAPTQTTKPTILLEGPYGHHCPVSSFDSVLLIAGGTGIASAVPYILEHVALSKAGSSDTTHMHLLWTARQASFIGEVFAQELRTVAQRDDFSADLFFTRQSETPKHGEEQPRGEEHENLRSELQYGRPDIAAAIAKAATRARLTGTKVAVLVCGPPAMADEARLAVHRSLKHGCSNLEYFEESFGW